MKIQRRQLLRGAALLSLTGLAPFAGCGSRNSMCADPELLSTAEHSLRKQLGYLETAPDGELRQCASCVFFHSAGDEVCGRCEILNGPVNTGGLCGS